MNHYTNRKGFNAIRAVSPWRFKARKQRNNNPFGAYFTTLKITELNFWIRVRLPKKKRGYVFSFKDEGDLSPWRGPRGKDVFYSSTDYYVETPRQLYAGET